MHTIIFDKLKFIYHHVIYKWGEINFHDIRVGTVAKHLQESLQFKGLQQAISKLLKNIFIELASFNIIFNYF